MAKKLSAEAVAEEMNGKVVDDWDQGEEIPSSWFKFDEVGKMVKGTLIGKRFQKSNDPVYPDQFVYELKTADGMITKVPIGVNRPFVNDKMKYVAMGQIVAFKYVKDVESQKFKGKFAKSIDVRLYGFDPDYKDEMPKDDDVRVEDIPFA
jgi:hypothetical protein